MAILYDVDAGSGPDSALAAGFDGDVAYDPIIGGGGGGGGGGPTSFAGLKFEALATILDGGSGTAGDGQRATIPAADAGPPSDGTLAAPLGVESGAGGSAAVLLATAADSGSGDSASLVTALSTSSIYAADSGDGLDSASLVVPLSGDVSLDAEAFAASLALVGLDGALADDTTALAAIQASVSYAAVDPAYGSDSAPAPTAWDADAASGLSGYLAAMLGGESASGIAGDSDLAIGSEGWSLTTVILAADSGHAGEADDLTVVVTTSGYHVYANDGLGGPISYVTPVDTVIGLSNTTWTSFVLATPGTWRFGVRAFSPAGEEQNLDAAVSIVFDANSNDVTNVPVAPIALRAFPTKGGNIKVEWTYPPVTIAAKRPTQFLVYSGAGGTPDYSAPVATIPAGSAIMNVYATTLTGLVDGTTYAVAVRAMNATGTETNTVTVSATSDAVGPLPVSGLTSTAVV